MVVVVIDFLIDSSFPSNLLLFLSQLFFQYIDEQQEILGNSFVVLFLIYTCF